MKRSLGIYLHIPFCIRKCFYCDFCSVSAADEGMMQAYTEELCRRIRASEPLLRDCCADTVYVGGGTPTLLPISCFFELFRALRETVELSPACEITCECNPATADEKKLTALRHAGINRLSVGLQSADDSELRQLGRVHSAADFETVFLDARRSGFDNISVDLMYGIPSQTAESWRHTLDYVLSLRPEHLSAYGLKIEPRTRFDRWKERLPLPDEEEEFAMYRQCGERLRKEGYHRYEISNFARDGKESRHNLKYWLGEEYLGFGVAAYSCFGGERFGNSRDLTAFLRGADLTEERETLTDVDRYNEYVMLRMRLERGIDGEDFRRRFGDDLRERLPHVKEWLNEGLLQWDGRRLSFTDRGFFVSNAILSEWLIL